MINMDEQQKNSDPTVQLSNRIKQLYANQEIIVKKINDHNSAIRELSAAINQQKEYFTSLIESQKSMMASEAQINEAKELQSKYDELKSHVDAVANYLEGGSISIGVGQKIIEKQDKLITLYNKTHNTLINQVTEKEVKLSFNVDKVNSLMNTLAKMQKEMLDIAECCENEQKALKKQLHQLYYILGGLGVVVLGLALKLFLMK